MKLRVAAAALLILGTASAQTPPQAQKPQAQTPPAAQAPVPKKPWELEWDYYSRYHDDDLRLGDRVPGERRIVFMGDSITEGWMGAHPSFFRNGYIDRGISGQTSAQMLVRFRQDVINLRPDAVVILAGTNDIAENNGRTTPEAIEENIQSMVELARAHGIKVVLSSVLPAYDFPWRKGLEPADKIYALNQWITGYCAGSGIVFLDYYRAMADSRRGLPATLSEDGVHPNKAGYAIMEPLARAAISRVFSP